MTLPVTYQSVLNILVTESPCTLNFEELAERASCSHASVKRAIRALRKLGWIRTERDAIGRGHMYRFEVPQVIRTRLTLQAIYQEEST